MTQKITRLAVVGGRDFSNYQLLKDALRSRMPFVLISGGAKGADQLAERFVKEHKMEKKIFYPNWDKYGKSAGYIRNKEIIANCDKLIAFWDGKSNGTRDSIAKAQALKIPVTVITF